MSAFYLLSTYFMEGDQIDPPPQKKKTTLKKPSLIRANTTTNFQSACVIETGLSDFHLTALNVMKRSFTNFQPGIINYRSYENLSNETLRESSLEKLSKEVFVNNDDGLQRFCVINLRALNQYVPQKIKYV